MSDIPEEAVEPVEGPETPAGPEPAAEEPAAAEEPETPVEGPESPVWVALTRVVYVDAAGNEFFCGPGETIPDEYVGNQVDVEDVTAG